MRRLDDIRNSSNTMLAIGSYKPGYQAVLDFDALCGKSEPSIVGIIGGSKRFEKMFFGDKEVLIPCFRTFEEAKGYVPEVDWLFNTLSARRAPQATHDFFRVFENAHGAHLFAEDIPEIDAIKLFHELVVKGKTIAGPAGVGLLVPGHLKLGVVGGVDWRQLKANHLRQPGSVAIMSASGGMTNELINMTIASGALVSFALCFGGDRFPATTPRDAFLAAEADSATKHIVYYGELGGEDEYELVDLVKSGQITKPVTAYVAGIIGESFSESIQFGHAKALARLNDETASAKQRALKEAGVNVASSIEEFSQLINEIPRDEVAPEDIDLSSRKSSSFTSTIGAEADNGYEFVGKPLQDWAKIGDVGLMVAAGLLGRTPRSSLTSNFVRDVFLLSVDHGPQVSGALNTIVTARAGKGLVDSLAAGLLTVGPRFGGAVTGAAREWFDGVGQGLVASELVEKRAKAKDYIQGIGHKKYRIDIPDPRTKVIAEYADKLKEHPHFDFAKSVEKITTQKKGNLILNVDGHIAALMLDILQLEEGFTRSEINDLINNDFFNALFVIPRTVGFVSHYLDQKRLEEGLFRLPDDDILLV